MVFENKNGGTYQTVGSVLTVRTLFLLSMVKMNKRHKF